MEVSPNKSTDPSLHSGSNCLTNFCRRDPYMEALLHQPPYPGYLALCSPPSFHTALPHLGKEGVFSLEILYPGIQNKSPSVSLLQLVVSILFLLPCLALLSNSFCTLWPLSCKQNLYHFAVRCWWEISFGASCSWLGVVGEPRHKSFVTLSYRRSVRTRGFLLITGTV